MAQPPLSRREMRERERERGGPGRTIAAAIIVLVLLVAGVWVGTSLLSADDTPSATPPSATPASGTPSSASTEESTTPPTSTTEADPLAAPVAACQEAWRLQKAAQTAAFTSLSQWRAHLDVMNRLQAGAITLAAAKAEWAPTTVRAPENIVAFRTADQAFTSAKVACVAPDASMTGPQADALRTCAASSAKLNAVLAQARITIAPWETHLKDQSHFKAGEVSSAAAEAAWRVLWRKGVATIGGWISAQTATAGAACALA